MNGEMRDETDIYLERCLKNWSARQKPPVDVRGALIRAAARQPGPDQTRLSYLIAVIKDRYLYPEQVAIHKNGWLHGPLTLSPLWSFQLAYNCRMAT